jgi:hypothetical protein
MTKANELAQIAEKIQKAKREEHEEKVRLENEAKERKLKEAAEPIIADFLIRAEEEAKKGNRSCFVFEVTPGSLMSDVQTFVTNVLEKQPFGFQIGTVRQYEERYYTFLTASW